MVLVRLHRTTSPFRLTPFVKLSGTIVPLPMHVTNTPRALQHLLLLTIVELLTGAKWKIDAIRRPKLKGTAMCLVIVQKKQLIGLEAET